MKRLLAACLLSSSCALLPVPQPPPPIVQPAVVTFDVVACKTLRTDEGCAVPIVGATVRVNTHFSNDDDHVAVTNGDGYTIFSLPDLTGNASLFVTAEGYLPFDSGTFQFAELTKQHNVVLLLPIPIIQPEVPDGGEHGRVRVDGARFVREDGSSFGWRGCTDFLAFKRFRDREDLRALLAERIDVGCNTLRVLGMVDSFAKFRPDGDGYYQDLAAFADLLARYGLRFEFVVFADTQVIMPDFREEKIHIGRVVDALSPKVNVFVEVANEPFKNIPGGGSAAFALGQSVRGRGVLIASGDYEYPPVFALDYGTIHTERKPEWPRTAKDLQDFRDIVSIPWVADEPTGFAENPVGDSRTTSADDAAFYAGVASLMGAGATFHSDAGLTSVLYGPLQRTAAVAFFSTQRWVPVDAQFGAYQRGDADGGPGVGRMPIEHTDAMALRTFCKQVGNAEYCVAVRPAASWTAIGRDGWNVTAEPRRGLIRLER